MIVLALYIISRLYSFTRTIVPIGYDPGLYAYLWKHDLSIPWLKTIYPPVIFYLGKFLTFFTNPENIVIPMSFAVALVLFGAVWAYSKNKWTMLLLATSAIQYKLWWWYYIKQILATAGIFGYLALEKKHSKWVYLMVALVVWTHQPTAIVLMAILMLQRKWKSIMAFLLAFAVYYLPTYKLTVLPFLPGVATTIGAADSGTFYNLKEALPLMLPYLPLTIYGVILAIRRKTNRSTAAMLLITFLIPLLGLFLSRRFIPFFDIFALVLAGIAAREFFAKRKVLTIIYAVGLILFGGWFVANNSKALILEDEFNEIKLLNQTEADAFILTVDNEYTPWIYGYSGRKPITPGFGEYDIYWSYPEWDKFWQSNDRKTEVELLKKLPKPLYIFTGDRMKSQVKFVAEGECFERYSWHVWRFVCDSNK
jgi:hypothetical protein